MHQLRAPVSAIHTEATDRSSTLRGDGAPSSLEQEVYAPESSWLTSLCPRLSPPCSEAETSPVRRGCRRLSDEDEASAVTCERQLVSRLESSEPLRRSAFVCWQGANEDSSELDDELSNEGSGQMNKHQWLKTFQTRH